MVDRRSAWFLRARTELHDKTCHFCRQCNGHCSGPAVCGERAPTAGPDCKCHRTRKQRLHHILCTNAELQRSVLIFHTISIILCLLNVLHLISSAGSPFVTPWQSITRELSLCGNLSRAQRRVSVTAQLAPRAGGPQVATGGTVRIHSDTGSLLRASNHPGERPAERANGVTTGRQLQVALLYGTIVFYTALEQGQPITKSHY